MNARLRFIPLVLLAGAACSSKDGAGASGECHATVAQGELAGLPNGATCEYRGVPYAVPPLGRLRFAAPEPALAWDGTRDATRFGEVCAQPIGDTVIGAEDCLFLNVYTPKTPPDSKLPVMVWLHGGSFLNGAGSDYDGRLLSESGPVVVVTVNYRLGAFGAMHLPELDAARPGVPPGNDGIRDQQLALRWVRENAARFGGDAGNVTLFGESAGSFSACTHLVSPSSRGLSQRYIFQSASCTGFGAYAADKPAEPSPGRQLVDELCTGAAASDPLACLRSLDANVITRWKPAAQGNTNGVTGAFHPIVDATAGSVLPASPPDLIAAGDYDVNADIVAGTNRNEAGLLVPPYIEGGLPVVTNIATFHDAVQLYFRELTPLVELQYAPASDAAASDRFTEIMTDLLLRCPTRTLVRETKAAGTRRVYLYSYEADRAFHTDEIAALLPLGTALARFQVPEPPASLAAAMKGYWTRFAATGDPNGPGAEPWPGYDAASDAHLVLAEPPEASAHLAASGCDFWDRILAGGRP